MVNLFVFFCYLLISLNLMVFLVGIEIIDVIGYRKWKNLFLNLFVLDSFILVFGILVLLILKIIFILFMLCE